MEKLISETSKEATTNDYSLWDEINGKAYNICGPLGKGAYGTVFEAYDKSSG